MTIQLVDLFYPEVFRRYNAKYNIYRELYEKDLLGIEIRGIDFKLAQKIKKIIFNYKEICYNTGKKGDPSCDLLALGSYSAFNELSKEIIATGNEEIGFKIAQTVKNIIEHDDQSIEIGGRNFSLERAYTFGILNVTPDSFSDGGKYFDKKSAVEFGLKLLDDGADILDIGGESSRPGSDRITIQEELDRVLPVIEEILLSKPDALLSIDTTKSEVAKRALSNGVKVVNDISSFGSDDAMLGVVNQFNAVLVLMHMKGDPKTMQQNPYYEDVVSEIYDYLTLKVDTAKKAGVKNIIIDPGIGFGKRVTDNYEIIKRLNELKGIGNPIMAGISKKSFLGRSLNLKIDERDKATLVTETLAIQNGARFIRTHDVKNTIQSIMVNSFIENPDLVKNV